MVLLEGICNLALPRHWGQETPPQRALSSLVSISSGVKAPKPHSISLSKPSCQRAKDKRPLTQPQPDLFALTAEGDTAALLLPASHLPSEGP